MTPSRHRIVHLAETGSTNADAMRFARAGEDLPLWVSADRQTEGRGRSGRSWVSDAGNLQASLAIASDAPVQNAGQLSLLAGIALVDAIRAISPLADLGGLRLKWPNDLLIGPAKAGGILVETTTTHGEPGHQPGFLAVIGFGVNVSSCPGDLGRATASLAEIDPSIARAQLLDSLADQCDSWIERWDGGRNFEAVRQAWMARAGAIGEAITVPAPSGPQPATYQGLSDTGALLADIGGTLHSINFGDVGLIAPIQTSGGQ